MTPGLCLKCGPTMIRPLIPTSEFPTELGDVFADPAFPPTRNRSAVPCKLGCFHRVVAPATTVHKPTPNFAVGRGLIPRPLLPRCRNTRHPALATEVRVESFANGHGDSRFTHCEPENAAHVTDSAVTNARFASLHGLPVGPFPPLDHARSASQTARSSRASIRKMPQLRRASVCGSAAGRCASAAIR